MSRPPLSLVVALTALVAASIALWSALPDPARPSVAPRQAPTGSAPVPELRPGSTLAGALRQGETRGFVVPLHSGELLHAAVDQLGTDVVVTLWDPAGRQVLSVDGPDGGEGRESVIAVAGWSGRYRLEVRPFGDVAGPFAVRLLERRPADGRDRARAAAVRALWAAERWRGAGTGGSLHRALGACRAAREGFRESGDMGGEARALRELGRVSSALGDPRAAVAAAAESLALYRRLGDVGGEIRLSNDLGVIWRSLGQPGRAEEAYRQALGLARGRGDRLAAATALSNLGGLHDLRGEPREALDAYEQELALHQARGDRMREAQTLHKLGVLTSSLGLHAEALSHLERALRLRRGLADLRGTAATLTALAWVHHLAGEPGRALPLYAEAIALRRQTGDRRGEAVTLDRRGRTLARAGRTREALAAYGRAMEIFRAIDDRSGAAVVLANLGLLHVALGDPARAVEEQERALRFFRATGDRRAEAEALLGIAAAERRRGRLEAARAHLDAALALVEALRGDAPGPELRTSFLAFHHEDYELCIDLLMELAAREPGGGYVARAFEISERARARTLLESLAPPAGATQRSRLPPRQPAGLREVQRLLDDETRLLVYSLGEERSWVWVVGPASIVGRALPGRSAIEARARRAHDLLSRSHRRSLRDQAVLAAAALAGLVLAPVRDELGARRLVIVADGALQTIPFAALPDPGAPGEPLLAAHEIVHLPSASVLAWARRSRVGRPRVPGVLAVLADPVFGGDDARLPRPASVPAAVPALPRLPATSREAEAILALAPERASLRALGFDASRETVLSGRLGGYRFVHFATHGLLDADRPERSGVVLALVDSRGRPRDGLLRAPEIAGLELPVELVVLSACRTALGREVRGEGMVGLTHAFLRAGAARVMVSLWSVDDEATAELMTRFYSRLLRERRTPAQALREAQLSLRRDRRWQAPSYWAGFTLYGDWE